MTQRFKANSRKRLSQSDFHADPAQVFENWCALINVISRNDTSCCIIRCVLKSSIFQQGLLLIEYLGSNTCLSFSKMFWYPHPLTAFNQDRESENSLFWSLDLQHQNKGNATDSSAPSYSLYYQTGQAVKNDWRKERGETNCLAEKKAVEQVW